jgi:GNAT superfamily N-acetyltransferase
VSEAGVEIRRIEESDVPACTDIFNEAFNDVHRAYGYTEDLAEPGDRWLATPLGHFLSSDRDGGLIATDEGGEAAFASSIRRDDYWFLAFLFVVPRAQGRGLGRELLRRLLPRTDATTTATMVESYQSTAMGLYAREGMIPCSPKHWLVAPTRSVRFADDGPALTRTEMVESEIDRVSSLDRQILGFSRAADHRWWMKTMRGFIYTANSATVGYAYLDGGWISPALAIDEETLVAIFADLSAVVGKDEVETAIF